MLQVWECNKVTGFLQRVRAYHVQLQGQLMIGDYDQAAVLSSHILAYGSARGEAEFNAAARGLITSAFYLKHVGGVLMATQDVRVSSYSFDKLLHPEFKACIRPTICNCRT